MSKPYIQLLSAILFVSTGIIAKAQVDVTSSGGTVNASYTTLNAAFNAVNLGIHTGTITINIQASTNEGSTTAVLNASGTGGIAIYSSVVITPTTAGVSIIGNGSVVIKLQGADNVTINGNLNNGSGATRDLSIENQNATASGNTAVIWLAGPGCTGNTIKNCNIKGSGLGSVVPLVGTYGIYVAGTFLEFYSGSGADNDNLIISNNSVTKSLVGIWVVGTGGGLVDGLIISNNIVGSNTSTDYVSFTGMVIDATSGAQIYNNTVFNIVSNLAGQKAGILIGGIIISGITASVISKNRIYAVHNQATTGVSAAWGITILSGTNHQIVNNMIYDITDTPIDTTRSDNAFGILLATGTSSKLYYNSVNMTGHLIGTEISRSAALAIGNADFDIRNNVFQNKLTSAVAGSKAYAIAYYGDDPFLSGNILDYNGYFVPTTNTSTTSYFVGIGTTTDRLTLSDWQTFSGQDANSIPATNQLAPFVSDNDLHVTGVPVESAGINITGIMEDFDDDIRQDPPDIGCDEIGSALPVTFLLFNSFCESDHIKLTWKTAQEFNSDRFDIEVSSNAVNWIMIGSVNAAGTSLVERTYSFIDLRPSAHNFYRIVEYDIDGHKTYSIVLRSSCSLKEEFAVWPNPVTDKATVSIKSIQTADVKLMLYDAKGAIVQTIKRNLLPGQNQFHLDMNNLPKGFYILKTDLGGTIKSARLVKQ